MTLPDLSARLRDLRAARHAAYAEVMLRFQHIVPVEVARDLDTLLRLHAQVTTLENAEKMEADAPEEENEWFTTGFRRGYFGAAAFLRATVEGA